MGRLSSLLLALAVVCALFAQTTAEILGTVTDESGAVIAGAKITARNTATGIVSTATSGEAGQFRFTLLQPGKYEVTIEKAGFAKLVRPEHPIAEIMASGLPQRLDLRIGFGSRESGVDVEREIEIVPGDARAAGLPHVPGTFL